MLCRRTRVKGRSKSRLAVSGRGRFRGCPFCICIRLLGCRSGGRVFGIRGSLLWWFSILCGFRRRVNFRCFLRLPFLLARPFLFLVELLKNIAHSLAHLGRYHIRPIRTRVHLARKQPVLEAVRVLEELLRVSKQIHTAVAKVVLGWYLTALGVVCVLVYSGVYLALFLSFFAEIFLQSGDGCASWAGQERVKDNNDGLLGIVFPYRRSRFALCLV